MNSVHKANSMACTVCGSKITFGHKCPQCKESLCNRLECSSKCPGCKAIQYCDNCYNKSQFYDFQDLAINGDQGNLQWSPTSLRDTYCGNCDDPSRENPTLEEQGFTGPDNFFRCECGKETPLPTTCVICGKGVCEKCEKSCSACKL